MDTQIYKVRDRFTGEIRLIRGPVGATDEEVAAEAERLFADERRSAEEKKPTRKVTPDWRNKTMVSLARGENPYLAGVSDFAGGVASTMRGMLGKFSPELANKVFPVDAVDKDSWMYAAGQIADPVAAAIGIKYWRLPKYLQKIGLTRFGKWLAGSPVLRGMLTGGAGGATVAAFQEGEDPSTAGVVGLALGGAIPLAGRFTGNLWDAVSGKLPELHAREILHKTFGDRLPQARQLLQQHPGETVAQSTAPTGSVTAAALGEHVKLKDAQFYYDLANKRAANARREITKVAGGSTQTRASKTRELEGDNLFKRWNPKVQEVLGRADRIRAEGLPLAHEAARQASAASQSVDDVRRLTKAGKIAEKRAGEQYPVAGQPRAPGRYTYPGRLAEVAERGAQKAADESLIHGEARRVAEEKLANLKALGLKPLDVSAIKGYISAAMRNPQYAGNERLPKIMAGVADKIDRWVEEGGGIIDAHALYSIRKYGINEIVNDLLKGQPPDAIEAAAAEATTKLRPLIDAAITRAAGPGGHKWIKVLKEYEQGARLIDRMELGAKAMELFDKNPSEFLRLVKGESPETVRKIFKTESNIGKAMLDTYVPLKRAATQIELDKELEERAKSGMNTLNQILKEDENMRRFFPMLIDWKIAMARRLFDIAEDSLHEKTMKKVYYAMRSGKNAEEVLSVLPAKDRIWFLNVLSTNKAAPLAVPAAAALGEDE